WSGSTASRARYWCSPGPCCSPAWRSSISAEPPPDPGVCQSRGSTVVYLPPAFTETRTELLIEHIERHEFGLLVSHGREGMIASQIPFLVERRDGLLYLQGHLARANPQAADLNGPGEGENG